MLEPNLLETLELFIHLHWNEVIVLVRILLQMFVEGFEDQKGKILAFGKTVSNETAKMLPRFVMICNERGVCKLRQECTSA